MSKIPADSTDMELADDALCAALTAWLPGRRWYAGKGHDVVDSRILSRYRMDRFDHVVLGVELDGQGWHVYQVRWRSGLRLLRSTSSQRPRRACSWTRSTTAHA